MIQGEHFPELKALFILFIQLDLEIAVYSEVLICTGQSKDISRQAGEANLK